MTYLTTKREMAAQLRMLRGQNDGKLPAYAWPGGYPFYYLSADGRTWCPNCANQNDAEPPITAYDVNYEDTDLLCDGCGARLEAAYVDVDPLFIPDPDPEPDPFDGSPTAWEQYQLGVYEPWDHPEAGERQAS